MSVGTNTLKACVRLVRKGRAAIQSAAPGGDKLGRVIEWVHKTMVTCNSRIKDFCANEVHVLIIDNDGCSQCGYVPPNKKPHQSRGTVGSQASGFAHSNRKFNGGQVLEAWRIQVKQQAFPEVTLPDRSRRLRTSGRAGNTSLRGRR